MDSHGYLDSSGHCHAICDGYSPYVMVCFSVDFTYSGSGVKRTELIVSGGPSEWFANRL